MTASRRIPARLSPRPVRTLARRIARSGFARDLYADRYFLAACTLILVCAGLVVLLSQGHAIGWDGVYEIPTTGTGTDAGLLPPDAGSPVG